MGRTRVAAASAFTNAATPRLRTALLVLLALCALLLSVLAMHSAASAHVMGIPLPVSSSHGGQHDPAADAAHAVMTAAEHSASTAMTAATAMTVAASHHGMLDCALMVMGCVMLLSLAALVLLARPGVLRHLLGAGRASVSLIFAGDALSHRPSLTVLCISRV